MDTLLLVVGGAAIWLLGVALAQVWQTSLVVRRDAARIGDGEAVFILGYFLVDGQPCDRYRARLELGRAIWEQRRIPIWCLAGRLWNMERTNAYYSRRYLVEREVPAQAVRTLDEFPSLGQPVETIQEVQAAHELSRRMNVRRLIVISDLLHLAQVRLVLRASDLDPIFVSSSVPRSRTRELIAYLIVRIGMIVLTLVDRRGQSLGWLRIWRQGGLRKVARAFQS